MAQQGQGSGGGGGNMSQHTPPIQKQSPNDKYASTDSASDVIPVPGTRPGYHLTKVGKDTMKNKRG